jgi:hypothetical protein
MARWFRKKPSGLGWRPCTWQGWLVVMAFVGGALLIGWHGFGLSRNERTASILLLAIPLIAITVFTSGNDSDA